MNLLATTPIWQWLVAWGILALISWVTLWFDKGHSEMNNERKIR